MAANITLLYAARSEAQNAAGSSSWPLALGPWPLALGPWPLALGRRKVQNTALHSSPPSALVRLEKDTFAAKFTFLHMQFSPQTFKQKGRLCYQNPEPHVTNRSDQVQRHNSFASGPSSYRKIWRSRVGGNQGGGEVSVMPLGLVFFGGQGSNSVLRTVLRGMVNASGVDSAFHGLPHHTCTSGPQSDSTFYNTALIISHASSFGQGS